MTCQDCPYFTARDENEALQAEITTLRARLAEVEGERDEARKYLTRLFAHVAPQCTPLPDLLGLCAQIDNAMTVIPNMEEQNRRLVECVRKIRVWNKDIFGSSISPGLDNLLATVSDLTAAEDEVKL